MAVRLGELLLREKRITPTQLQEALNHQKANGGKLGMTLVKLGMVKDEEITALLSRQYGVPFINLAQFDIDASVLKLIPAETAQKYQIVPIGRSGATLTIAMTDPTNVFALDDIKFMTGYNVEPVVASETAVGDAILKYYQGAGSRQGGNGAGGGKQDNAAQAANTLDLATRSLGYWHDTGRIQLRERAGLQTQGRWLDAYAPRMVGMHLQDEAEGTAEMPPGSGEVDFKLVAGYLPRDAERVLDINPRHGRAEILAAVQFLADQGF